MSHFSVLVIGKNWEKQLAPYSEELKVEPYKKYLSIDEIKRIKKNYQTDDPLPYMSDWTGDSGGQDENGLYYWSTYNPQSKWDWYSLGGRWKGTFLLRNNGRGKNEYPWLAEPAEKGTADQALKKAIDWEGMIARARQEAQKGWEDYENKVLNYEAREDKDKIKYDKQTRYLVGILENDTKESFIARSSLCSTFAIVKDGEWIECAKMGWWGVTYDENMEENKWAEYWTNLVASLPNDTLLTLVDCHI